MSVFIGHAGYPLPNTHQNFTLQRFITSCVVHGLGAVHHPCYPVNYRLETHQVTSPDSLQKQAVGQI